MLFDKICRHNGITHRLTEPESPNQNGKVERFHGTFRPELLEAAGPFDTVEAAQAAVDRWVVEYNTDRPHQALDDTLPVTPNDRFPPATAQQQALVELWLPTSCRQRPNPTSATARARPRQIWATCRRCCPALEPGPAARSRSTG